MHHDIWCWRDGEFGCDRGFQGCHLASLWMNVLGQKLGAPGPGSALCVQLLVALMPVLWETRLYPEPLVIFSSHWIVPGKSQCWNCWTEHDVCNGLGLCFPFAGKHCHDNCFYKKKLPLWQNKKIKKKSNSPFAWSYHKPLLVIIEADCATV